MSLEEVSTTTDENLWRRGVLNDDEFERAALSFSPSWEMGLDLATQAGRSDVKLAPEPAQTDRVSFSAASSEVSRALAESLASPPAVITEKGPSDAPAATVASIVVDTPAAKAKTEPEEIVPRVAPDRARSVRPLVDNHDDEPVAKPRRSMGALVAMGAVALALVVGIGWSMQSNSTPETPTENTTPVTTPVTPSALVAAPTPSPAVAAPEPVAIPTPPAPPTLAATPVPEPVLVAPTPPAPPTPPPVEVVPPTPPAPPVVAVAPPAPPVAAARPALAAAHPAAAHPAAPRAPTAHRPARPRHGIGGAGFVTDNPY